MDLKVAQLAGQLLEGGFDNFAEREQPERPTVAKATRGCARSFYLPSSRRTAG